MARDPICGMEVSESQAAASLNYKGQNFYFCGPSCYDAFVRNPDTYLPGKGQSWWARFLNGLVQANRET